MRFNVSCEVDYSVGGPSVLIVNLHAVRHRAQTVVEESFSLEPSVPSEQFVMEDGQNRFVRIETGSVNELKIRYRATVETQVRLIPVEKMRLQRVGRLDRSVIPYLYPSRYCQSDKLGRLAQSKFGGIVHPFEKVTAITEWIFKNVEYASGTTNWQTSAFDTVTERAGVCRDFAHLGIALCRAQNIPARYFSGYAHQLEPADIHACFEAHIGGNWLIFDPTKKAPLNGLVRNATGRDAADASIATIFGPTLGTRLEVACVPAQGGFKPVPGERLSTHGICLDMT